MPVIPPGLRIPNRYSIPSGEIVLISPLLQEGCNALAFLCVVEEQLASIPEGDMERRSRYLLSNPEAFENAMLSLAIQIGLLEDVLRTSEFTMHPSVSIHLTECLSTMEAGAKYASEILDQVSIYRMMNDQEITPSGEENDLSSLQSTPIGQASGIDLSKKPAGSSIDLSKDQESTKVEEPEPEPSLETKNEQVLDLSEDVLRIEAQMAAWQAEVDQILVNATQCSSKEETEFVIQNLSTILEGARYLLQQEERAGAQSQPVLHSCLAAIRSLCQEISSSIGNLKEAMSDQPIHTESLPGGLESKILL